MIELTNTTELTLAPGANAVFNAVLLKCGCDTCTTNGTGSIKLRRNGVYEVRFTGNIGTTGATGTAQLSVALSGFAYPPSLIVSETTTAGELNSVERTFYLKNCCGDFDRLTVVNSGTETITIGVNAIFSAREVC